MKQYKELIEYILKNGIETQDRTGVGTYSVFGYQCRFDLNEGFPALTTKKLAWKAVVGELLWFLEGSTDERRLAELTFGKPRNELIGKKTIWTANAEFQGKKLGYKNDDLVKELGPVYGFQWRNFDGGIEGNPHPVDQISWLIKEIKSNPESRRLILSAWNPNHIEKMSLPPCHVMAQFRIYNNKLNCQLYQRSVDAGLGLPFNIASYSLLTYIIAKEVGLDVGEFVHTSGDLHIYKNHVDSLKKQLLNQTFPLPSLKICDTFNLEDRLENGFEFDDSSKFKLIDYKHHETIKMDMAV